MTLTPPAFTGALDLPRMRTARRERLVAKMQEHGLDALLVLGQNDVGYATGARVVAADQSRAIHHRPVALLTADGALPHLWTRCPDGVPDDLPAGHVHGGLDLESADGVAPLLDALPRGTLGVDELTMPLRAALADAGRPVTDGLPTLGAAKLCKTADEVECIRRATAINEAAIAAVVPTATPGTSGADLTGRFLRAVFDLGATSNTLDPVWQVMPRSIAEGPYTATGDVVFPTVTTDRPFDAGDVVWIDNGLSYEGYQSDYGHTHVVGRPPDDRQRAQAQAWRDVVAAVRAVIRPGATAADLTAAAGTVHGRKPWLAHFYLAHSTGTDSAAMPMVGTDLGQAFDEALVLERGMILVLEPVIWEDGHGGFRAEEIVALTDDGHEVLTHLSWDGWE